MTGYIKPMLCGELSRPFDNPEWLFEYDLDGQRTITAIENKTVNIHIRKERIVNQNFPHLVNELQKFPPDTTFDGEIVMFDVERNLNSTYYYISDVLLFKGQSLLKVPLLQRKALLRKLIHSFEYLRFTDHVVEYGCDVFGTASNLNLKGICAKKADSYYYPGKKSGEWFKIKTNDFVQLYICGFTMPSARNKRMGSIIGGMEKNGKFYYAGHVVTGIDNFFMQELYTRLIPLVTSIPPFEEEFLFQKEIIWVNPVIKFEIKQDNLVKKRVNNKLEFNHEWVLKNPERNFRMDIKGF